MYYRIEHFSPDGKPMPNGISYQWGWFLNECRKNKNAFSLDPKIFGENPDRTKWPGGIVVFPTSDDTNELTLILDGLSKEEKISSYSIGNAFHGKYAGSDETVFDGNSVTISLNGLSPKQLLKVAETIAHKLHLRAVIVKEINTNVIYQVSGITNNNDGGENPKDKSISEIIDARRNFLTEENGGLANNGNMVPLTNAKVIDLITGHIANGFALISPFRDYLPSQNGTDCIRGFLSDIRNTDFTFTPIYGEFLENKGTDTEEQLFKCVFVIYSKDISGKDIDLSRLYEFCLTMQERLCLDTFVIRKGEEALLINRDGSFDDKYSGDIPFRVICRQFLIDLQQKKDDYATSRQPEALSFSDCLINPGPACLSEAHRRYIYHEIALPYK